VEMARGAGSRRRDVAGAGGRSPLPLVLRAERFGGILFDPSQGTHVEVDAGAYDLLRGWLTSGRGAETEEERALLAELQSEIPSLGEEGARLRLVPDRSEDLPEYANARVLGAPTLVDLQLTSRCRMGCPHCYASAGPEGRDLPYEDVGRVLDAIADAGVCQLAIGGGEPLLHPSLVEVLHAARERGLVPNLTTTGDGMTPRVLRALADCCGAVALSLEGVHADFDRRRASGFAFFEAAREALRSYGIPTVFQVTLSAESLPCLPSIVDYCLACGDLYGVIFLAYKAVGRGTGFHSPLSRVGFPELYPRLRDAFLRLAGTTRVGYDCCLTPGIVGLGRELGHDDPDLFDGCSATRSSVGISTDLEVVPCTFLTHRPLGSLRESSLLEIWRGERAARFREELDAAVDRKEECRECPARRSCLGGCPEWDLVRCGRRARLAASAVPGDPRGGGGTA
jgi:radical SAM protein with 4Fe4S-binding SPASM domain